jgi:pimeloyl-ACP methyl ester carboxylesterase
VAPPCIERDRATSRTEGKDRAVVLIHGLKIQPLSSRKVFEANLHFWQQPDSDLVQAIAPLADIYSFAYSQNVAVDHIAGSADFASCIQMLKSAGYSEIVLVGHSAGGLIARQFVEDFPQQGVTKVVQVCSPNTGSCWGNVTIGVRKPQELFLTSLAKSARQQFLQQRQGRVIPAKVEFVCLVGDLQPYSIDAGLPLGCGYSFSICAAADPYGDGLVAAESQWPVDLRRQGIPMVTVDADHCEIMHDETAVAAITEIVRSKQPRWDEQRLSQAAKALGEPNRFQFAVTCGSQTAE